MNNSNELVSYSFTGSAIQGFTYSNGVFSPVNSNANYTYASAINNHGDVAGYYSTIGSSATGFLATHGSLSTFSVPGAPLSTFVTGVNDPDEVVGYFAGLTPGSVSGGFLRMPDGDITTFGSSASAAYQVPADINNAGIIVGSYADLSTDTSHGFVQLGGTIYSFDAPGARSTSLTGINNWNEIVGVSSDLHGNDKLFKVDFTPVPEPSALYLLVFGSTGLGLLTRLRIKHQ